MPDASISLSSGTTTEAQFRVLALPESALAVMIRENLYGEVIKVHAALESASSQLAQHPTTGLFFVNDHIQKSAPVVIQKAEILTQQQHMCKLSKDQAEEATVTVKLLRASGAVFCTNMHQQLDQAILACDLLPTMPVRKSPVSATAKEYVTKLPQLLSLSKLSLTRRNT
ncbi:hypothetical protein ABBQ38_002722 [Trebouxia sp. C0009 RCD-2024]